MSSLTIPQFADYLNFGEEAEELHSQSLEMMEFAEHHNILAYNHFHPDRIHTI